MEKKILFTMFTSDLTTVGQRKVDSTTFLEIIDVDLGFASYLQNTLEKLFVLQNECTEISAEHLPFMFQ